MILPLLMPRRIVVRGPEARLPPVVIYTDARYEPTAARPAEIGVVIYDPVDKEAGGVPTWRYTSADVPQVMMQRFVARQQYIGQLEVLAAVAAYTSRPEQLRGRDVIHFIDNTGALFGLAKGYSGDLDSARLIHVFHTVLAAVGANPWMEFVASGANIADQPSRDEFALLRELGAVYFEVGWPPIGGEWSQVFKDVFRSLAPRLTASRKRARDEVLRAADSLAAKRRAAL